MHTYDQLQQPCVPPIDRRHEGVPLQPQEVSDRACALVIDNIARYPQDSSGPTALIASELVSPTKDIGTIQVAQVLPDPDFCQQRVKSLYRAFGAEYRYGEGRTIYTVLRFAMYSLNRVQKATVGAAYRLAHSTEDELFASEPITDRANESASIGPWQINLAAVYSLDAFLNSTPAVAAEVEHSLSAAAAAKRRSGRRQQTDAREKLLSQQTAGGYYSTAL